MKKPHQPGWMKGRTPETWLCVDCGINTAPGMPSRVEIKSFCTRCSKSSAGRSGV